MLLFVFAVYRSDMPNRLSVSDLVGGISNSAVRNVKQWAHLGFVAFIWLLFVPVCVCKSVNYNSDEYYCCTTATDMHVCTHTHTHTHVCARSCMYRQILWYIIVCEMYR